MGRKKKDAIADQLNALSPNIPTQTRVSNRKTAEPAQPVSTKSAIEDFFPREFFSLFKQNMADLEKIHTSFLKQASQAQGAFLDSYGQMAEIVCNLMKRNCRFFFGVFS